MHGQREKEKEEKEAAAEAAREEREMKKAEAEAQAAAKRELQAQQELERARQAELEEAARLNKKVAEMRAAMDNMAAEERERQEARLREAEAAAQKISQDAANKIPALEQDLKAAHDASVRTAALATKTKTGYVYVISNIGSFGEDVVKIGMTRRQDPDDRVKELGNASVPFLFDTHAMIYSDDAPALETALHRAFDDNRVNLENRRKEFFRVSIEDVEYQVSKLAPNAIFRREREAQEWQLTLAKRQTIISDKQV